MYLNLYLFQNKSTGDRVGGGFYQKTTSKRGPGLLEGRGGCYKRGGV